MDLTGAPVLVTGASSGIGAALARLLAERGAVVGLVGRREDKLAAVLADCLAHGTGHRMWTADLGDLDRAEQVALEAWDSFGHLAVLVNNAAIPKVRDARRLSPADVEEAMRVNYLSPVRLSLAVLPKMLERGEGTIVNVTSLGARLPILWESAYCASKAALAGFTEVLAMDLADTPVRVRHVVPGPFATDIWDRPGSDPAAFKDSDKLPPELSAAGIVDAIEGAAFEWYVPDLKAVAERATTDVEGFMAGTLAMFRNQAAAAASDQ